jgi:hypothetical protein
MKKTNFHSKTLLFLLTTILFSCNETPKDNTPWQSLFDGQTLNGWSQLGGTANYTVRDQSIVGRS